MTFPGTTEGIVDRTESKVPKKPKQQGSQSGRTVSVTPPGELPIEFSDTTVVREPFEPAVQENLTTRTVTTSPSQDTTKLEAVSAGVFEVSETKKVKKPKKEKRPKKQKATVAAS